MAGLTGLFAGLMTLTAVFGLDADFQVDLLRELDLVNATRGIIQTAALHNSSKVFLFQDTRRSVQVPNQITERVLELLRNKKQFTFMASIQQKSATSGVLFSIHDSEYSYFELESSGLREEIRYRYCHKGKQRLETFPYRLADGQWHKIALSISAGQLLLHVDCNRIYEREIEPSEMDLSELSGIWLGQRSHRHGLFKGSMQDVRFIFSSNGYMMQCPSLNRTCPTCSDFLSLVQGIMDLQELLTKMTLKLNFAESRLSQLESCHCERSCSVDNVVYRDKELWTERENCRTCTCMNGAIECRRIFCPPVNCSEDSLPVHLNGTCCKKCRSKCSFQGGDLSEGQRVFLQSCKECKNGVMEPVNETCPSLNCTIKQQILPENRCCNVCRGHDFCAEGFLCGENSACKNRDDKAECECESGYAPIQADSTYCEAVCQDACLNGGTCASPNTCSCSSGFTGRLCETDIDECTTHTHTCWNDSVCVNLPGTFDCVCVNSPECSGDCVQGEELKHNGQEWSTDHDRCTVCTCKEGEVECVSLSCPVLLCNHSTVLEGECCPRCISDACMDDGVTSDPGQTCRDPAGVTRLSGAVWCDPTMPCTTCTCKNRKICCYVDLDCIQDD